MSHDKVHSQGAVPFSWEKRPGVSKVAHGDYPSEVGQFGQRLPPPPCPPESGRASFHELTVPLPPSGFQLPTRSSSWRGIRKQDDPFLNAYRECTKGSRKGKDDSGFGLRKHLNSLLCKYSVSVRDDSMVRISKLHTSNSECHKEL
ncbi:hypothetical protein Vadar_033201 [Vaccinium darrowii]|uniref:Uncharacterized protein n=1 Tax=Vaccinium darrowii TaxID=229202 RepID=A0ACB7Y3B9_9ERIC|nr:hypothetical protein Vadar_033201 [Vaccinium darrowii]